jgi:hypothetical protein
MASAAFQAAVKVSGAAVAITAEVCGLVSAGVYQVTNTGRRIIDPGVGVVVKDGGVAVGVALWSFDYLFGVVTFSGYSPTDAVTIDGSYLPTATAGECNGLEFAASADLGDASAFESQARKKIQTLIDCSGSLNRLVLPLDDLDTVTVGNQTIDSWFKAGTPKVLDVLFATGGRLRVWLMFGGYKVTAKTDSLVEVSVEFSGAPQRAGAVFGWGA